MAHFVCLGFFLGEWIETPPPEIRTPLNVGSVRISYPYFSTGASGVNIDFAYSLCFNFQFSLFGLFGFYKIFMLFCKIRQLKYQKSSESLAST